MADDKTEEPGLLGQAVQGVKDYVYEKTLPYNPFGQAAEAIAKGNQQLLNTPGMVKQTPTGTTTIKNFDENQ